jgi:regulator of protease activity HflC (stomatin/prohibitin superfamily)
MSLFDQNATPETQENPFLQSFLDKKKAIKLVASLIVILPLMNASIYTIQTGTVGVISTFGKYNHEEILPGLSVKMPFVQTLLTVDVKMQTANYNGQEDYDGGEDGIYNLPQIQVLDEKNLPIGLDVSVQFSVSQNGASETLEKYGQNYFNKALHPVIRDVVRDVTGKYQAETIASNRSQINAELEAMLQKELVKLPEFSLKNVALRDITLPPVVMQKISQVQEAKQEEQRLKMIELQAQQDQKIKQTQAETNLIQVTTAAKAEADKLRIEAEGRALAIAVEAKAQAQANELIAKSLTPELVKYNEVLRWNGQMPTTLVKDTNGTSLLLGAEGKK